ncbi:6 TM domain-containing transmembrane protein [Acrasis kona]|uniref:6 TM domain-containing transmembrane protein n=1 Tax=Acrasis kona TaxID=1008807 RepID=A0AAW2ZH34_9EUKA
MIRTPTQHAEINAKRFNSPGMITMPEVRPVARVIEYEIGGDKVTRAMHVITSLGAFLVFSGASMVLAGAGMILSDWRYFYNTIGIVMTIGFGLWLLASVLSLVGSFRRNNKKGYVWSNLISSIMFFAASACLVLGSAFWLSYYDNTKYAGRIMWLVGGGLLTGSFFIRVLGVFWDATDLYKHETYLPNESLPLRRNEGALVDFKPTGSHKLAIWGNALASSFYLAGATAFWIATYAMYMMWPSVTKQGFENFTGVLWIISMGLIILGSISHMIGRK